MPRPRIGQAAASEIPSFRPYKTACAPKTSGIKVKTVFRHLKEGASPDFYTWTSNPYRGTAASGWTRTRADQLGRVVEVGHFSGAGRPSTGSPPALGATGSPNQATSYSYNALDNLTREKNRGRC